MNDTSQSGGGNSLRGIIIFAVIAAGWTGFNYWRAGSEVESECKTQFGAESTEFCSCFKGKILSEVGIGGFVPIIGRFIRPGEDQIEAASMSAMGQCLASDPAAMETLITE